MKHSNSNTYSDGGNIGLHSKFFIIDDICSYIGSQNLYICDLVEWGVIIDDQTETEKMIDFYWKPMWEASYIEGEDCNTQEVMDGLKINRDGEKTKSTKIKQIQAVCLMVNAGRINDDDFNTRPVRISQSAQPESIEVISGHTSF